MCVCVCARGGGGLTRCSDRPGTAVDNTLGGVRSQRLRRERSPPESLGAVPTTAPHAQAVGTWLVFGGVDDGPSEAGWLLRPGPARLLPLRGAARDLVSESSSQVGALGLSHTAEFWFLEKLH